MEPTPSPLVAEERWYLYTTSTESTLNNSFYYVIFFTDLCKHTDARYCRVSVYFSATYCCSFIHRTHLLLLSVKLKPMRGGYRTLRLKVTETQSIVLRSVLLSKWQWHAEKSNRFDIPTNTIQSDVHLEKSYSILVSIRRAQSWFQPSAGCVTDPREWYLRFIQH